MKTYILRSLLILCFLADIASAKDVVDKLINKDQVEETEYITHYNESQAIISAKALIKKHKGTALEPSLRHRLADLYIRGSKTRNFVDQVLKKKGKDLSGEFESLPAVQKILKNAILELQTIEKQYPKYNKMDEVYYTMGMSYIKLGDVSLAERPFLKLTKIYKKSPLVQDANLSLAEIYYHQKNYSLASNYFTLLASDKNHKAQAYSFYKRAWTKFYRNKFSSAFDDMKQAYSLSKNNKNLFDISMEVLSDLPLISTEVIKGHQVYASLKTFIKDKSELNSSLDSHAKTYAERSDYRDETSVLNVLLKRVSSDKEVFETLHRLTMSYEKQDNLVLMAKHYEKASKYLSKKVDEDDKNEFLVYGRNFVKQRYKEWTKRKDKVDVKSVLAVGDLAQQQMGSSSERPKFINIIADLHLGIKSYVKASEYYEEASDLSKNTTESHDLLYSSIFANQTGVIKDKWKKPQVLRQRHLVTKYDKKYPQGKHNLDVLYKMARVEEKFGSQNLALETFKRLGSQFPNSIKGKESQDFVITIFDKKKDYFSVNDYLVNIIPNTRDKSRVDKLKPIYDNSFFLMAEANEKKGRYKNAVKNYKDYLKKSYLKSKTTEASWNIAVNYKKSGLKSSAASSFLNFYNQNKNHKNSKLALEDSFSLYENTNNYKQLEVVASILEKTTSGAEQDKWAFSRARIALKLKNFKTAESKFYSLVKIKDKKLSDEVHQLLFDHVDKKNIGFKSAALRVLQTGQEPFRSEALIRVAIDYKNENKTVAAKSKFQQVLSSPTALSESKAKASIFIAEMDMSSLSLIRAPRAMGFDTSISFIERTMKKVNPVTEQLQAVLTFSHGESSLRSLIKLSRVYLDLGVVLGSINVNDKPDLKLAVEREIRKLKSTVRSSFYESYEKSLNLMAQDRTLKRKYNSRVKKIKQEFEEFNKQNAIAMRGE